MLGTVSVSYNDLENGESLIESFSDVESVSVVGNIEGPGNTIIINHKDDRPNTVRDVVVFQGIE